MARPFPRLVSVWVLLAGCPDEIHFGPAAPGSEAADPALVGTWTTTDAHAFARFQVTPAGPSAFDLKVLERGPAEQLHVDDYKVWTTRIEGRTFVYAQPAGTDVFYLQLYALDGGTLRVWDVLDGAGMSNDASTEAIRARLVTAMHQPDFEAAALSNLATFHRVEAPAATGAPPAPSTTGAPAAPAPGVAPAPVAPLPKDVEDALDALPRPRQGP